MLRDDLERWGGWGGASGGRGYIDTYAADSHCKEKPIPQCKAIILQLKIKQLEGGEQVRHLVIDRKSIPGRGSSQCQSPGASLCRVCLEAQEGDRSH